MTAPERPFSIVCLSPAEWDAALPTNRQQIMLRAARRGHDVLFVETSDFFGVQLARLARGGNRRSLARRLFRSERVEPRIRAVKALNLVPWGRKYAPACAVNTALTALRLRRRVRALPAPRVVWIYDPCAAGLAGRCSDAFAVYDVVDDYAEQAGPDPRRRALVARANDGAARLSRVVFATTRTLEQRLRELNPRTHLVRNVGDYEHFAAAADRSLAPPELRDLPAPVLGFAGSLTPEKVDFALLEELALARPDWTLVLLGPAAPESRDALARLARLPNLHRVGGVPYAELPRYVAAFDVALIPYAANAYTRCCFPLKLFEYLAAGKAVVATGLPDLAGMEPDVLLVEGAAAFERAVTESLARAGDADRARRAAIASQNTWETRASRLLGLVETELAS